MEDHRPWVEKYRPNSMDEISHQPEVVAALKTSVTSGKIPHLLLYGPPGTGKTSTILALAKQVFGAGFYRKRILELNASDERGIQMVREKIKKFAQKKITKDETAAEGCPPLQLIILDEADSMTVDAQSALRRIIEVHSKQTRFCIICNYVAKIIEPLASRCIKFRFTPISNDAQTERLKMIAGKEGVRAEEKALEALVEVSEGDLRRSIMMLQTSSKFTDGRLEAEDIYKVSGKILEAVIEQLYEAISD